MVYFTNTIDYLIPGKVVFTMFVNLEDMIVEADEDLKNSRSYYPGHDQLFKFHCHVAILLFASKRTRPHIQVCVEFLCTPVKLPTEQDYKKLGRVISYLKETAHLLLVIGANES